MAKSKHRDAPEFIEEFEGAADRMANWVAAHAWQVGGGLVAILLAAWGLQAFSEAGREREGAASNALDDVRASYLLALGASPGSLEVPELANPAAAQAIHEEYLEKFQGVAADHPDTVAGTLALFETAELMEELGREEQTARVWEEALKRASGNARLQGMLQQRIAAAHEDAEAWSQAARAHEAAAAIAEYPLRYWAMLDAGRCWLAAGESESALALFERVETEAPDLRMPDHLKISLRELRAAGAVASQPSQAPVAPAAPAAVEPDAPAADAPRAAPATAPDSPQG